MVNIYETEFFKPCPVNGIRIHYYLRIEAASTILVENIMNAIGKVEGFHEVIADDLHDHLPGTQTLRAEHHGVAITTIRP